MRTEPTDLTPAAIYLRRSTDKQEQSLSDQRREIERYALENGYRLVAEFVDDGVSGTSGETRQGFLDMLEAAKSTSREWSTILVWDVKRFGRMSSEESGYYLWQFRQAGVSVVYTSEGFTGTPVDRYMHFFKQEAARDESVTLSKAVGRGLVSLAEDGWWTGGPAPYGFDLAVYDQFGNVRCIVRHNDSGGKDVLDPDGHRLWDVPMGQQVKGSDKEHARLVPSMPERVEILRRIFAWYIGSPPLGFKAIADRLNREGVASPRGRGWAQSSIREIIRNDVYVGRSVWNKRSLGKFHRIVCFRQACFDVRDEGGRRTGGG